jgi:LmbE family N-acetylglucosaminyl deacetylase
MKNVLFIVSHPDDEVLGAGGTIYNLAKKKFNISVAFLSSSVEARFLRPSNEDLNLDIKKALDLLGVKLIHFGNFPNIKFNNINHLDLVQFIEKIIISDNPDIVFTHHPADLNNDHFHTSIACQAAVKLYQRRNDVNRISEFYFMEILSSTDWSLNTAFNSFKPNSFFEINEDGLQAKINSLMLYKNVMRPYPHPRSEKSLRALATYRGSQHGLNYAEAFECVYKFF